MEKRKYNWYNECVLYLYTIDVFDSLINIPVADSESKLLLRVWRTITVLATADSRRCIYRVYCCIARIDSNRSGLTKRRQITRSAYENTNQDKERLSRAAKVKSGRCQVAERKSTGKKEKEKKLHADATCARGRNEVQRNVATAKKKKRKTLLVGSSFSEFLLYIFRLKCAALKLYTGLAEFLISGCRPSLSPFPGLRESLARDCIASWLFTETRYIHISFCFSKLFIVEQYISYTFYYFISELFYYLILDYRRFLRIFFYVIILMKMCFSKQSWPFFREANVPRFAIFAIPALGTLALCKSVWRHVTLFNG